MQRYWRSLAHWKPETWHLSLAVYMDDEPVGVQDIWANDFFRARSVGTCSWITRSRQGKGFGTESRSAVLEFAFSCLMAGEARTEYYHGNIASERVSRKLGYVNNGERLTYREGSGQITECPPAPHQGKMAADPKRAAIRHRRVRPLCLHVRASRQRHAGVTNRARRLKRNEAHTADTA